MRRIYRHAYGRQRFDRHLGQHQIIRNGVQHQRHGEQHHHIQGGAGRYIAGHSAAVWRNPGNGALHRERDVDRRAGVCHRALTDYISAHGNPWLAGQPAGQTASQPDPGYDNPSANKTHPWKYDIANPAAVASAVASATSGDSSDPASDFTVPADSSKVTSTDYSANEPYASPVAFDVKPGAVLQISVPTDSNNQANNQGYLVSGTGNTYANGSSNGNYANYSDDGANPTMTQGTTTTSGSENGISNIITPINSMVGVFMDQNGTTYGADSTQENETSVPPGLDFSTQAARDYSSGTTQTTTAASQEMESGSIEPQLNQAFYVGNGQTSSSTTETIVVPNNAYAIFLGTMDGHEWSNNVGGFNATITEFNIELVQ